MELFNFERPTAWSQWRSDDLLGPLTRTISLFRAPLCQGVTCWSTLASCSGPGGPLQASRAPRGRGACGALAILPLPCLIEFWCSHNTLLVCICSPQYITILLSCFFWCRACISRLMDIRPTPTACYKIHLLGSNYPIDLRFCHITACSCWFALASCSTQNTISRLLLSLLSYCIANSHPISPPLSQSSSCLNSNEIWNHFPPKQFILQSDRVTESAPAILL